MKKRIISSLIVVAAVMMVAVISGFRPTPKPWSVPEKFLKMTNPLKADADVIKDGKGIWVKHCQSCHGKTGLGDGPKAAQLKTEPGDLSSSEAQKQNDGSLFYKISEGRDDMPSFKKKLQDEEEIWQVIIFLRTLKK
ncbi:MAG TPA: c-type cytochrome [Chitinophagaceae bacterium]